MARAAAEALEFRGARAPQERRTGEKYERLARKGERIEVREGDLRFLVNLDDYIDTGLFADHRVTRALVRKEAGAKRFLNLFAYTGRSPVRRRKAARCRRRRWTLRKPISTGPATTFA